MCAGLRGAVEIPYPDGDGAVLREKNSIEVAALHHLIGSANLL
jgi:hypothetical protein